VRLTLRTLLAYLDDTLEPAQARLIGQKVMESEVARDLIERIKQVTRRRRLAAPPASGPGSKLDPNTVADYLDNVLPEGQVAEVEETFLNSDVHLAEVAACHQILTLFLGQPAQVPPTAYQRMVGLVKGRESIIRRRAPRRHEPERAGGAAAVPGEADEALLLGMSSYLRRHVWARRLAPVAAVLGLVALLLLAIWQIVPRGGASLAQNANRPTGAAAEVLPPAPETRGAPPDSRPAPPPDPTPKDKTPPDPMPKDRTPPDPTPPKPQDIHKLPDNQPSKQRRDLGKFVASDVPAPSILLQRQPGKEQWLRVKPDAAIAANDPLVSLPGYRSEIHLDTAVSVTLWGNLPDFTALPALESSAVLHVPPDGFDLDITLKQGLVVVANRKPAAKARARVRFLEERWDLILDEGSAVALNLFGTYTGSIPFKSEGPPEAPLAIFELFALKGDTSVKIDYEEFILRELSWYRWDNTGPRSRNPQALQAETVRWYTERDKPLPDTAQLRPVVAALKDLSKRFGDKPAAIALAEARKEAKGPTLALSIFCLAAVDDLQGMMSSLIDERPEVRWFAGQALRHWIAVHPDNDMKLYKALQRKYNQPQAEAIMKMLHGFTRDDWNKAETYEWLIDKLESKELALRELAYVQLLSVRIPEAAKIPYRPADPEDARKVGVEQWRKLLETGKLPPMK